MPATSALQHKLRLRRALLAIWWPTVDRIFLLSMLPHFRIFKQNTLYPTCMIIHETDGPTAIALIENWIRRRKIEVNFVQVAGAVLFTSVVGCFSWTGLDGRHWTAPAFWYCSIVLAITAVILGAQQFMVLDNVQPNDWKKFQRHLRVSDQGEWRPERTMLYVWQSPLMAFSYSTVFFMAGLLSYVISPFAHKRVWDEDAKTMVMFLAITLTALLSFIGGSARIHHLLRDEPVT